MNIRRISAVVVAVATMAGASVSMASADGDDDRGVRVLTRPPAGPTDSDTSSDPSTAPRPDIADKPVSGDCDQSVLTDRRGDAKGFDIVSTTITSDCWLWTFTTRFAKPVDFDRLGGWAITIDTARGRRGCVGGEYAVVLSRSSGQPEALIVATPSCNRNEWITIGRVPLTRPDRWSLQVTFGGSFMHTPQGHRWSVGVSTRNGQSFDVSPNEGAVALVPPVPPPSRVEWDLFGDNLKISWNGNECLGRRSSRYALTTSKDGAAPTAVKRDSVTSTGETIEDLAPNSTYVVSITSACGERRSHPYVFSVDIPTGADLLPDGVVAAPTSRPADLTVTTEGKQVGGGCNQPVERDGRGDGTIDIASIRITSDCRRVQFTLTTHRAFADAELGDWGVFLGPGDYCDGMRWVVLVSGGSSLSAELYSLIGECSIQGPGQSLEVERLSPTSLRFTLPGGLIDAQRYTWFSYTDRPDGEGADGATPYTVSAHPRLDPPRVGLGSSLVSGMAYLSARTDDEADYYEVQHRRPGTQWSPIKRTGGDAELELVPGVRHEVRVRAVIRGRRTAWKVKTTKVIVPPGVPRDVEVTATDDLLTVEFRRPASTGGAPLSAITVQYASRFGFSTCIAESLRCEFADPYYSGLLTLWSETVVDSVTRTSPAVVIGVDDPTP